MKALGVKCVLRYLWTGEAKDTWKALTAAELAEYHARGIGVIALWEASALDPLGGYQKGASHGRQAARSAETLGYPGLLPIITAIDFDASLMNIDTCASYVRGFRDGLAGRFVCGVYGDVDIIRRCAADGTAAVFHLTGATSWSRGETSWLVHLKQTVGATYDDNQVLRDVDMWLPHEMTVLDTIPTTSVTVPTYIRQLGTAANGNLPTSILRRWGEAGIMFTPVSYALQALHLVAADAGIVFDTVGDYRPYADQVNLFLSRYSPVPIAGRPTKVWNGKTYWQKPGTAMAATPGTSNHGYGLANDLCLYPVIPISDRALIWMRDNGRAFGFGLETRAERWHWHWLGRDALSQTVVDTLDGHGVSVPNLAPFGFTVPAPTPPPPGEDEMTPVNERAIDTRSNGGPFTFEGEGRTVVLPGAKGMDVAMVCLTVIPELGTQPGYFAVSADGHMPNTSAVQLAPGQVTANSWFTAVNGDGAIDIYLGGAGAAANLIVDVEGVG